MPGRSTDGGIHVHVIAPLTPDACLAGLQPLYEQLALAGEDLPIKAAATATASRSPAPGCPRRPAPRRPDRGATGTDPEGKVRAGRPDNPR